MTSSNSEESQKSATNRLASHPEASPELLDRLVERSDAPGVAERVAENAQASPDTLDKLASHDEPAVRSAVADNENASSANILSLAEDKHPDVRFRVAENPQVPAEVLESLSNDENPFVARRAQETLSKVTSVLQQADQKLLDENFEEAEGLYRRLKDGLQELLGTEHKEVARIMHKLAAALAGQGKIDEAAAIEEQARFVKEVQKKS